VYARLVAAALLARGLAKRYGSVEALAGVDLEVGEGELVGLLGPNGAGKSTLTKIACGLVRPSAGGVEVGGAKAGSLEARRRLGYLAELFRFPGWTSADELLVLHQRLSGSDGGEAERTELLDLVGLLEARTRRVEAMSKGMQQRLGIAQALVGTPRVLLLDEPTSALDPVGRRVVRSLLEELRRRGVSVLLNSHLLSEVELVCDRVVILLAGKVVAAGAPADLAQPRGIEVETDRGRRVVPGGRDDVPRVVEELVRGGERVYEARLLTSTLEEVYLDAVGGETS
jgi:ABC-2 type transport system ATP-binding protein